MTCYDLKPYPRISLSEARTLMGRFDAEIDVAIRMMDRSGIVPLCIPSTGKTLWVSKRGCVTTFQVEV